MYGGWPMKKANTNTLFKKSEESKNQYINSKISKIVFRLYNDESSAHTCSGMRVWEWRGHKIPLWIPQTSSLPNLFSLPELPESFFTTLYLKTKLAWFFFAWARICPVTWADGEGITPHSYSVHGCLKKKWSSTTQKNRFVLRWVRGWDQEGGSTSRSRRQTRG